MKYVGITIGPIFKTISEAHSPAGLWLASTFFSEVTKAICTKLLKTYHKDLLIFSPYFTEIEDTHDGIGKYHDRILFASSEVEQDSLSELLREVKSELGALLGDSFKDGAYLARYIKTDFVIFDEQELEGKNLLFELNQTLDRLELILNLATQQEENAFVSFFNGKPEHRNSYIKRSPIFGDQEHLLSKSGDSLKTIDDIVAADQLQLPYYALVSSDGDKVGKLLDALCQEGQLSLEKQAAAVQTFSKACLNYAKDAAEKVHQYGGMTIYAGGDDLLFFAPVSAIFDLVPDLNQLFKDKMKTFEAEVKIPVSLSFGISIHYKKFPLYESLEEAHDLLHTAKKELGNRSVLSLSKHSGQTFKLSLSNDDLTKVADLLKKLRGRADELKSIIYSLHEQEALFTQLTLKTMKASLTYEEFRKRLLNFFDNDSQAKFEDYLDVIGDFYFKRVSNNQEHKNDAAKEEVVFLHKLLRLNHFFTKKEEDNV